MEEVSQVILMDIAKDRTQAKLKSVFTGDTLNEDYIINLS